MLNRVRNAASKAIYGPLERLYRRVEATQFSRGATLSAIPYYSKRGGGLGTITYGEWAWAIGIFQAMIFQNLPQRPIRMLDVGCGAGRVYLAAKPSLTDEDTYLGIDVGREFVENCRRQYGGDPNVSFLHTEASNAYYAKDTGGGPKAWPMKDASHNLITAVSVWTHLREEDWRFYLNEVGRVLQPGGRAILTFFILDEHYHPELKGPKQSRFYPQPENKWIFDASAGSDHWWYPSWADVPEAAIAVDGDAFKAAVDDAGLKIVRYLPGSWKDQPGFYFQDVVVFERAKSGRKR